MQLNRIVVGTDFSMNSVKVAEWTAAHFAPRAQLVVAHVVDVPQPPRFLRSRFPPAATLTELARHGAVEKLGELARALDHPSIQTQVRVGRAAEQLAELAREVGADAIVVGKHSEEGTCNRIGGVADQLLRLSPVPVLVAARVGNVPPRRLLVALDDSELTPLVVDWTRTFVDAYSASVTALHVMSSAVLSHVLSMEAVTTGKEKFDESDIKEQFREESDRWIRSLAATGLDPACVTSEVAFGEAGKEILAAAQRLSNEMIILGRRGAGGIRRFLLGSVVREVLTGARCPVFVVIEPNDEVVSSSADVAGGHPQGVAGHDNRSYRAPIDS